VVTWGNTHRGGDCRRVKEELRNVKHIEASHTAFAALRSDGVVVTWGNSFHGGDSRRIQDQLTDVRRIQ
ncbi:unnamed protein product, partial [Symbiodinium necroappetens]